MKRGFVICLKVGNKHLVKKALLLKWQRAGMCIYVSKHYCTYFFFVTCIKFIDSILSKEYKNTV